MKQGFYEVDFERKRVRGMSVAPLERLGPQILSEEHWGETFQVMDAQDVIYTFPNDLPVGWNIALVQRGDGRILFTGQTGVSFLCENDQQWTVSRGKNTMISFIVVENPDGGDFANILVLGGAVAP